MRIEVSVSLHFIFRANADTLYKSETQPLKIRSGFVEAQNMRTTIINLYTVSATE